MTCQILLFLTLRATSLSHRSISSTGCRENSDSSHDNLSLPRNRNASLIYSPAPRSLSPSPDRAPERGQGVSELTRGKKKPEFHVNSCGKSCLVLRDGGTKGRGRISPRLCEVSNAPQRGRGESTRPRDEPRGACASVSSGGNNNNNNKKKPTLICGVDIVGGLN